MVARRSAPDPFGVMTMGFLQNLKLRFAPPRIEDPVFGSLSFMYIANAPEKSYWEGEWKFPSTGTNISIALPGDESGPLMEARHFYLGLPSRFETLIAAVRPALQKVFREWLRQDLPEDIFTVVTLAGFDVEDLREHPVDWDVSFETTGNKWLGIVVPFVGDAPQDATVDT
jgi:hypothetical protein